MCEIEEGRDPSHDESEGVKARRFAPLIGEVRSHHSRSENTKGHSPRPPRLRTRTQGWRAHIVADPWAREELLGSVD